MIIGTKVKYFSEHGKILGTGKVGAYDDNNTFVITDNVSDNGNYVEVVPNSRVRSMTDLEFLQVANSELQDKFNHLRGTLALLSEFSVNNETKSTLIKLIFDWVSYGGTLPLDLLSYIADNTKISFI